MLATHYLNKVVGTLLANDAMTATKYLSTNSIVRATRRLYGRKIDRSQAVEVLLTIGKPNYLERDFIKDCRRAGESFPVRKIQLRFPPKRAS